MNTEELIEAKKTHVTELLEELDNAVVELGAAYDARETAGRVILPDHALIESNGELAKKVAEYAAELSLARDSITEERELRKEAEEALATSDTERGEWRTKAHELFAGIDEVHQTGSDTLDDEMFFSFLERVRDTLKEEIAEKKTEAADNVRIRAGLEGAAGNTLHLCALLEKQIGLADDVDDPQDLFDLRRAKEDAEHTAKELEGLL